MTHGDFQIMRRQIVSMTRHATRTEKLYPTTDMEFSGKFPAYPTDIRTEEDLHYWVSQFATICDQYVSALKRHNLHRRLAGWNRLLDRVGCDALNWQPD